jgi:hypothetical protein
MLRAPPAASGLFSRRSRSIEPNLVVAYFPGCVVIHSTDLASFS